MLRTVRPPPPPPPFIRPPPPLLTCLSKTKAQKIEVYDLAITPSYVITVSSGSSVKLWGTGSPGHPLVHQFSDAHPLGAHHITAAEKMAATVGFGGEIILWDLEKLKEINRIKSETGKPIPFFSFLLPPPGKPSLARANIQVFRERGVGFGIVCSWRQTGYYKLRWPNNHLGYFKYPQVPEPVRGHWEFWCSCRHGAYRSFLASRRP